MVARSRGEETYVGSISPPEFIELTERVSEGSWETATREGTRSYSAFSRSAHTGLTVGLALPREEVDGPIRRIFWLLAGAWVVVLGVGAAFGLGLGHVIVRAMRSASQSAMALANGQAVSPARGW